MKRTPDPHIARLLGAERARKGPPMAHRARVRERVNASILLPLAPPGAAPHAPPPPASPPAPPLSLLHPTGIAHAVAAAVGALGPVARGIVVAVTIATSGVGLGILVTPREPATKMPASAAPSAVVAVAKPGSPGGGRGAPSGAPDLAPPQPPAEMAPSSPLPGASPSAPLAVGQSASSLSGRARAPEDLAKGNPSPSSLPALVPPPAPTSSSPVNAETLAAERALLAHARGALRAGDPSTALGDLDVHARTFPSGVLAEERDAITVQALVAAGRATDARAAGARFRATYPWSLLERAVDDALQSIP